MDRTKVFVSYSHLDRNWLDILAVHLGVLERRRLIEVWSDTRIEAGLEWEREIDAALTSAKIAVLLITPGFLASPFIWYQEMPRIVAHAKAGMSILPLIARPCAWRLEPELAKLEARPGDGRPLSSGSESQVDADLTAFAYELAKKVGLSIVDEPTEEVASAPGKQVAQPPGDISTVLGTWTGRYNGERPISLVVVGVRGSRFEGTMEYPRERTRTRVEGSILEQVSSVDPCWAQLGLSLLAPGSLALMFRETGYEEGSQGSISFQGEYRVVLSNNELSGAWFADGGRLVGSLHLRHTA